MGFLRLTDVAGRRLEGRRGEAHEIEAGHRGGDDAEEAVERRVEVEGDRAAVVHRAGEDRDHCGEEREQRRGARDRDREARDRADPEQVDPGERQHDADRERRDGDPRQVPLVQRGGREDRREAAGRNPAPPVTDTRQVGEDGAVGAERLRARGRDATDPLRPHQHELDPTRRGGPAEQHADDQDRNRATALGGDQRTDQEHHLVGPAHRERRGAEPADRARMVEALCAGRRRRRRIHTCAFGRSGPGRERPTAARQARGRPVLRETSSSVAPRDGQRHAVVSIRDPENGGRPRAPSVLQAARGNGP